MTHYFYRKLYTLKCVNCVKELIKNYSYSAPGFHTCICVLKKKDHQLPFKEFSYILYDACTFIAKWLYEVCF